MSMMQCRYLIRNIREKYKTIVLQCIPSHCGIPGNEKADEFAKKGSSVNQASCNLNNFKPVSSVVNQIFQITHASLLIERTKEKSGRNTILKHPDSQRSSAVAAFCLAKKHDMFNCHDMYYC